VVHVRHATCYLFYARLSNNYLRNIVKDGAKYSANPANTEHIVLKSSRQYIMRHPIEQAAFFTLLAKLFNYMVSGNSYIGYLCNNKGNKFVPKPVIFQPNSLVDNRNRSYVRVLLLSGTLIGNLVMKKANWTVRLTLMIVSWNQTRKRYGCTSGLRLKEVLVTNPPETPFHADSNKLLFVSIALTLTEIVGRVVP
jgi:hypothetical protein